MTEFVRLKLLEGERARHAEELQGRFDRMAAEGVLREQERTVAADRLRREARERQRAEAMARQLAQSEGRLRLAVARLAAVIEHGRDCPARCARQGLSSTTENHL